ncbi:MAG: hypothetical protein HGA45_25065 [Chloroflexales bacterium]|nr:hypothetical protein [Chloroflexales bacterium]
MLRPTRPTTAHQPAGSAAIARARLMHTLGADRIRHIALPARERVAPTTGHTDEILGRLLGESLPASGRGQ